MFQVRFHGRGGQGVVTAAELLSMAAFAEGRHAQAFPSFGSERTGAPVMAFCRIDTAPIRAREPVVRPDALVVQDATLLAQIDVFQGLAPDGYVLINSVREVEELTLGSLALRARRGRALALPATQIAMRHLGRPVPNAALLGGFAAMTAQVSIQSLTDAIGQRFSADALARGNAAGAEEAFALTQALLAQLPRKEGAAHA